jgi:succinate dehydrogenase / fumarate reductase cytochrome b subunit
MSDHARDESKAAPAPRPWRRFHSVSGAFGLGLFLTLHLLTHASVLFGDATYALFSSIEHRVLSVIEVVVLAVLAFHLGYGVLLLRRSDTPDAVVERYGDKRRWILQRISATFVLVFVLAHLWELRVQRLFFGLGSAALPTVLTAHLSWTWGGVPWIALFYLLGIAGATFHFANGFRAARSGAVVEEFSRRRTRIVSVVVGCLLFLFGSATVIALATGTRLLRERDADSAPCGSAIPPARSR